MSPRPVDRTPRRRKGRAGLVALAALVLFMAFVVYRSFHLAGVRCEVCLTYHDRTQCRTVEGANEEEARMAAVTNVCAFLAGGVTDSMACSRTPPTRSECTSAD